VEPEDQSLTDVDDLVAALKERVAERRRNGAYPTGLESELDSHFQRIVTHRAEPYDFEKLRAKMGDLDHALGFSPANIHYDSSVPGGVTLHHAVAKIVGRQTQGILEQMHRFGESVRDVLREMVLVLEHPNGHAHPDMLGQIDAILERLVSYERAPDNSGLAVADLRRRIDELEQAESRRRFRPFYASDRFEDEFRGTREEIRERYADLADRFEGCAPVVDIGCGRGELLELLSKRGTDATGIDLDADLVAGLVNAGLAAEQADAITWLRGAVDSSLGGISMIQVVEHLTAQELTEVAALAAQKLRRGGKLILETVNPQSLYVFARAFYVDPTHHNPVHPAYLTFLLREAGFSDVSIEWRSPPAAEESLAAVDGEGVLEDQINEHVTRLNDLLFGPQDYAIVAVR
jgi:SAM-dependent methyltransferase